MSVGIELIDDQHKMLIQRLGELLNNEIQQIEKETGIVDSLQLLVLSSLKITDKLLQLEEVKTGSNELIDKEISKLTREIENIL